MAAICDYTALELLKHVVRQELLDFHKVYIKSSDATESMVALWDEQYICIGRQEIFFVKCPYAPLVPPVYMKSMPTSSLPKVVYRFPFLALEKIVVPEKDDYGFELNLLPSEKTMQLAEHYNLYTHPAFESMINSADERKEIPQTDEVKDELIDQVASMSELLAGDQTTLSKRDRDILKKKLQTKSILYPYWSTAPKRFQLISLLRLPIVQSIRAAYKVDSSSRDRRLLDVVMERDRELFISPFDKVNLIKLANEYVSNNPSAKQLFPTLFRSQYSRANYNFLAWDKLKASEVDTQRPFATYVFNTAADTDVKKSAQSNDNIGVIHTETPELLNPEELDIRRRSWVHALVIKVNSYETQVSAHHIAPNKGHTDYMFASQLEFIAHSVAKDHNQTSFREQVLRNPNSNQKFDNFSFKINSEVYKKTHSLTNDRADYFCYQVHVITRERQIAVMGVRRKYMPPDAARCQDLVFILVGRKLLSAEKAVNRFDSKFSPDEMRDFVLPLRNIVDSICPFDSHPQAYISEAARCEWEFAREAIARFPMELESLRELSKRKDAAALNILQEIENKKNEKNRGDSKKGESAVSNPEFLRLIKELKIRQLEAIEGQKVLADFESGRIEKVAALYGKMDSRLREAKALLVSDEMSTAIAKQLEVGYRSLTFQAENTHATPSHAKKSTKKAGKSMILCGGDDSDLEDDSFQNNINEPWNQTDKYTRLRRNYAPLNFTAYDERLIMSKLNALLFDVAGFEWCARQDWAPREHLRAPEEKSYDEITSQGSNLTASGDAIASRSQSFYDWGLTFARCAFNPIREIRFIENEETKDLDDKEKGNRIFKMEHEVLQVSNPWDCWLYIVKAIHNTFLPVDPLVLQSWSDRLATYLTFVLELGWRANPNSKILTLTDLLSSPVSRHQLLTNWQLTNIISREKSMDDTVRWTSRTIEDEKELNRESLLEVLLHPHNEILDELYESEPHWFYPHKPDIYHHTGSIYVKLLENHLIVMRMRDAETVAREALLEKQLVYKKDLARYKVSIGRSNAFNEVDDDEYNMNEPPIEPPPVPPLQSYPIYPFLHVNEHLLTRLFDCNYFRWKVITEIENKDELPENEEQDNYKVDASQVLFAPRTLQKVPPPPADRSPDPPLLLADLPTAVLERSVTLPELIASILVERNYNQSLIFSVCNWIIRVGTFGPDMKMASVCIPLQSLIMRGGGEMVSTCLRALTTIVADHDQNLLTGFFSLGDQEEDRIVYIDGGEGFVLHVINFLFGSNSSSALLQATCQFLSVIAANNTFASFIKDTISPVSGTPLIDEMLNVLLQLICPVLHNQRHDPKLITSVCRLIKRLAFFPDARSRMWPLRFVEALAKLIQSWKQNFGAMDQALRAVANLVFKLQPVSGEGLNPPGWDKKDFVVEEVKDGVSSNIMAIVTNFFKKSDDSAAKAVEEEEEDSDSENVTLTVDQIKEKKLALKAAQEAELKASKLAKEKEEFRSKMIKPDEIKLLLHSLMSLLSQSGTRTHRENCLLVIRNLTYYEPTEDDYEFQVMNPITAYLIRKCDFETVLNQLYTGYASIITDIDKEPVIDVSKMKISGKKEPLPNASTQAREMDLIRFLLDRLQKFREDFKRVTKRDFTTVPK